MINPCLRLCSNQVFCNISHLFVLLFFFLIKKVIIYFLFLLFLFNDLIKDKKIFFGSFFSILEII